MLIRNPKFTLIQVRHPRKRRRSNHASVPALTLPPSDSHRVRPLESNYCPSARANEFGRGAGLKDAKSCGQHCLQLPEHAPLPARGGPRQRHIRHLPRSQPRAPPTDSHQHLDAQRHRVTDRPIGDICWKSGKPIASTLFIISHLATLHISCMLMTHSATK